MHYLKQELLSLISNGDGVFDFVQKNTSDGIWIFNLENQKDLWFNDRFWEVLGYRTEDVSFTAETFKNILHPDDQSKFFSAIEENIKNPLNEDFQEIRCISKNGDITWFHCFGKLINQRGEKATRMIGGFVNSAKLIDKETLLMQKSQRLNALLNSVSDMLLVLNSDGNIIEYFSNNANFFSFSKYKFIGSNISNFINKKDAQAFTLLIKEVLSGKLEIAIHHFSLNDSGKNKYFETRITRSGVDNEVLAIIRDITNDKSRNEELRKLELVTSKAKDAITITDKKGYITWVNDGFSHLTGYAFDEVIGKLPKSFLQGELTDPETIKRLGKAIGKIEPIIVEILNYHKSGSTYWIELNINPVYNGEGVLEGYISVGRDVSARKSFENELITTKNLLAHSSDVAKIGGWQVDLITNEVSWTDGVFKLIGTTRENFPLTFEKSASIIHPDDYGRAIKMFEDAINNGKTYDIEKRLVCIDGSTIHVKSMARVEYNSAEKPVKISGVFQDITEQKRAAKELNLQARLLESVGQAVIATKPDGIVFYWNKKAEEIYGWAKDEALGKSIIDLTPSSMSTEMAISIMEELSQGNGWSGEFLVQNKQGETFLSHVTNQPIFDEYGQLEGIIGVSEDIRERKNAELELLQTKNLLQQTNLAANVGGWQLDFEQKSFYWSEITRRIFEITEESQPNGILKDQIEAGFSYYKDGFHKSRIMAAADHTMRSGEPFDLEVIAVTTTGFEKWVRVIGNAEMKNGRCVSIFGASWDINNKKKIDETLRLERQKLNDILIGSGMGTFEWDMVVNHWDVNDQWYAIHGLTRETAPDINMEFISSVLHPEDDLIVSRNLQLHLTGKENYFESEFRIKSKTKDWKWVHIRGRVSEWDQKGKPSVMYGTLQEISNLKKMEIDLKDNAAKFSSIFHFSPVAISLNDLETGKFIDVNEVLVEKTGFSKDELLELSFNDITPKGYELLEENKKRELIQNNKFGPYEKEYLKKDGTTFPILCNCLKYTDQTGGNYIITIIQDISEQKKLINDLNHQRNKSAQDALYYKSLLENNSFFVVKTDLQGNYIFLNKYFCERLGILAEDYLGKSSLNLIIPEDQQLCIDAVAACFENPGVSQMVQLRKPSKNGIVHNQWEFILMADESLVGYEIICIGHEITPLIKKQEELQTLVDVTAEQNSRLMQFTHIVSHNLRSHVANLSSILAVTDTADIEDLNLSWNLVEKTTIALDETLYNLNEVIGIQSNTNIPYRKVNLYEAYKKTIDSLQLLIDSTGTLLHADIQENDELHIIPAYLDSILLNFISNAIKYRSLERKPEVRLSLKVSNGYKVLSITDNGLGIDLERYKDRLFGMYKTFHGNKDAKGLGLFITKAQIETMKGKIEVESTVGEGTTFRILLPEMN
jgi:PAS domain S-box-containing protein